MNNKIRELHTFLEQIKTSPVPEELESELRSLLTSCWEEFAGSGDAKMTVDKLDRMDNPEWDPPILYFKIERQGAMNIGSSRAEKQGWAVNLNDCTASNYPAGYTQIGERAKPWKAEPVGEELAQKTIAREEDLRLKWLDKDRVQLLTSSVIPNYHSSPQETINGRRRRLFKAMENILIPAGWHRSGNRWKKEV